MSPREDTTCDPKKPHKAKRSKRHGMSSLPELWREKIFENSKSERLKLAVAVLSTTGCRPAELQKGVMVKFDGERLSITAHGAKVDEATQRGQPLRVIFVQTESPWGRYLSEKSEQEGGVILVKYNAESLSQRLREKSRSLWPRRKNLISAYTFRHAIARSMKESGISAMQIAAVLGHACDLSQAAYGRAGGGKRFAEHHGVINAITQNPVRHSTKIDRFENFLATRGVKVVKPKI